MHYIYLAQTVEHIVPATSRSLGSISWGMHEW